MRAFVAIELNEEVRASLVEVQHSLRAWSKTARWVDPKQLHLTVKFLGDVPDEDVPVIVEAMGEAASVGAEFELTLLGAGCFPPKGPVRIVWVGASNADGAMDRLVESSEASLEPLGFPREDRSFSPHLTIGRVREDASGGKLREAVGRVSVNSVTQRVSALTLMSSELSPQGPKYAVVHRAALGAGTA